MQLKIERAPDRGSFGIINRLGSFVPLIFNGETIDVDGPDWFLHSIHDLGIGLYLVEWKSRDTKIALHFYNDTLNYITNSFSLLAASLRELLVETVVQGAKILWNGFALDTDLGPSHVTDLYKNMPVTLRHEILAILSIRPDGPRHIIASNPEALLNFPMIKYQNLRKLFEEDFFSVQAEAFFGGGMKVTSPFSDLQLRAESGLFVHGTKLTRAYAYRFADPDQKIVFFLLCNDSGRAAHLDWCYSIHAVFIPAFNVVLYKSQDEKDYSDYFFWEPVEWYFYREIVLHGDLLLEAASRIPAKPAAAIYFNHIGHHLWNELSGLDRLCKLYEADAFSASVFLVQDILTEMFGKIETLFPKLAGQIDRTRSSFDDLKIHFYKNNFLFLHLADRKISKFLADRIIFCSEEACPEALSVQYSNLSQQGFKVIILGLRVENRTLVDLKGFYISVILEILKSFDKVAIVVDGHNQPNDIGSGKSYESLHTHNSSEIDRIELDIFQTLNNLFAQNKNLVFISTLKKPVSHSIFWCSRSEFFVCPWGAGLAKYKWVCNRPGLVVSGRNFLLNNESNLYDIIDYREGAIVSYRVTPDEVVDRPDILTLIPNGPLNVNFDVDFAAVAREIRTLSMNQLTQPVRRGILEGAIDRFVAPRFLGGWIKNSELLGAGHDIVISVYKDGRLIGEGKPNLWRSDIVNDPNYLTGFSVSCSEDIPDEAIAFGRLRIEAYDVEGRFVELHIWDVVRSVALQNLREASQPLDKLSAAAELHSPRKDQLLEPKAKQAISHIHDQYFAEENRRLFYQFESLGSDCSFGGMQRAYGAEPLGLLRFAGINVTSVINALRDGFKGVGAPEYTRLVTTDDGEYFSQDFRYHMSSHTFINKADVEYEKFFKQQCKKISFLVRNMLEKLKEGEKIFVVHAIPGIIEDDVLATLMQELRNYGSSRLLYLEEVSEMSSPGHFLVRDDGVMVGYVLKIQGELTKPTAEVRESWMLVCKKAAAFVNGSMNERVT